ncbi:MAG TPA: ABC transporter permease [Candidatus Acidoferrales bacterium]|nr:ABC transporter permease [Candidatus Acidoferrales bacterium]HEV2340469.1 ABC transporter permease [Candidatus Acidoferrales bacterium]
MKFIRAIRNWWGRRSNDRELDAEVHEYIQLLAGEKIKQGMSAAEAQREAKMEIGGIEQVKEQVREVRAGHFLETLWQDLWYGLRMLRKSPGFTAVAVITLALGIGANTAIFSVIDGVLLSPLAYPKPQQLIAMKQNDSLQNVIDIQRQSRVFSQGGGVNIEDMDYTGGFEPVQIRAAYVDAGLLETLGIPPMLGRIISPDEDVKGGPRNIVVSHRFWQDFLSSDPNALGRAVTLSGNSYTVIGVMPASFELPREHADVFVSLWVAYPEAAPYRGVHFMHTYWRLKPGVTLAQAQADMSAIDHRLAEQYPDNERGRETALMPLHQLLVGNVRTALLVLFGAVGLVLLIACANFAGLLMARAIARRQELVIRAALGAGSSRLIRQALTESALLAIIGGAAGLLLAKWGTSFLLSLKPAALERFSGIQMDAHVLLFVFSISVLTGIIFGLAPAWSAVRADVSESLKEGGRSATAGPSGHMLRKLLIVAEFALALVLLVGAGLLMKGFSRLRSVDPGFNPANVMTMHLQLPATRYAEIPPQTQFRREVLARLNSLPGVEAAMVTDIPLGGDYVSHSLVIDGRPPVPVGAEPEVQTLSVMGDYFRVMQIPIRAGRDFTAMDREGQPLVAVVNEEFVRKFFPHEDPLGGRIDWARTKGPHNWMSIIGVAGDVKHSGLNQPADPAVYAPFAQSDEAWRRWMTLTIRTRSASAGLVEAVKKQVWSVDSQIPVSDAQSMDGLMAVSLAQQRFNMLLLGFFAALALILAAVGIYGLMAYGVSQRTHEIGIRIALGAQRRDVLWLVVANGAKLALSGIAVGVAGALALTRVMTSLLFEVKPTDPATFVSVAILLTLVALLACYIPARRAMRVDPMVALRYE